MPEHTWRSPHQINNSERETRKNRRGSERKREKTDEWCLPVAAPFNHLSLFCMCIFLLPSFIPAGPVLHLVCDKWPTSFVPSSLHSSSCLFVFSLYFLLFFFYFLLHCTFSHRDGIVPFVAHPPADDRHSIHGILQEGKKEKNKKENRKNKERHRDEKK